MTVVDFDARREADHLRRALRLMDEAQSLIRAAARLLPADRIEAGLALSLAAVNVETARKAAES